MKQEQFLDVASPRDARRRWHARLDLAPRSAETVPLAGALGRVLARDVVAADDVPAFDRSNVDGWAVRSEDTFGAEEGAPVALRIAGPGVDAGHAPQAEIGPGETVAVATGAMLPRGADAVVMVEDSAWEDGEATVRLTRPATPGARVSASGSDVARGEVIVRAGTRLTARETGTLAACGVAGVSCHRRPRVAVLSTGDELVPPGRTLGAGQVHDANATMLVDAIREMGYEAVDLGIARDDEGDLRARLDAALAMHDAVLLSGGTSKGGGDLSYRVVAERAEIVVHGVALKPGKPLCLAHHEGKPVVVLPGFPTSALFTFHAFVAPVLRRLAGEGPAPTGRRTARLLRRQTSERGRVEFTLVNLLGTETGWVAVPLGKGSGSVTTFARADGFFEIPADAEWVDEGAEVEVTLLGSDVVPADLVAVGSHCTGLDVVLGHVARSGRRVKAMWVGSRGGLEAARAGACDVAPVHLFDRETGRYNAPFVPEGVRLLPGYARRQGMAYRREQQHVLGPDGEAAGAEAALRAGAAGGRLRLANRNPASGTRALVERILGDPASRPPGWHSGYTTHSAVASAIRARRADFGVCLEWAARSAGLCWRPLADEQYDFLVPASRWDTAGVRAFREALADLAVRAALEAQGFAP